LNAQKWVVAGLGGLRCVRERERDACEGLHRERDALAPYLIIFCTIMEVYQLIMPLH